MLRASAVPLLVVVLALAGSAPAESPFNVDFFCGWGGCYRPMEWTPVEIGIAGTLTEPFAGSVTISAQQDGLNTLNISHEFVLTPDIPLHLPLVTKLAFGEDKCTVRIADKRGRTQWRYDFDLWSISAANRALTVVREGDLLIGLVGYRKFGLLQLSKQSVSKSPVGMGQVYIADKLPRMVPWDWTGFTCLDLLILYDPDWTAFNRQQLNAVAQWVSNGGRLLLVLGSRPLPADNAIAELLAFELQQARQTTVPPAILKKWQLSSAEPETVTCWPLKPKPEARICRPEDSNGDACLFGTGYYGFGRMGVLTFDPSTLTDKQKANSSRFWVGLIAAVLEDAQNKPAKSQEQVTTEPERRMGFATMWPLTGDLTHPDRKEGGIQVTLGGLEPGSYRMTSYHNNPYSQHSRIDIYVDGALYSRNNRQSQVMDDRAAAIAITDLKVSDGNDVAIEFRPVSSSMNRRAVLCGLEIVKLQAAGDSRTRILRVDFGATGQIVAEGFIGLGLPTSDRKDIARFDESDGLPPGVTITLKPTNAEDTLQFNPSPSVPARARGYRRVVATGFPSSRSIEFVEDAGSPENIPNEREYAIGQAQAATNTIMEHLYAISEMRPLSIWWVILLLTALAFLLGPVDYKLLKRLDHLPLTWFTCALWITLFTVGAYYGVQALRGGKMQLRAVTVLDGIEDNNCTWSAAYLGLFAPHNADYQFAGLEKNQWWSGIAPMEESIWAFGRETAARNIYCFQHDGGNLPYSLPVNIWTMQCLLNESPLPDLPFTAELARKGDELVLKIVNQSDSPILKGCVIFGGDMVFDFVDVPARADKEFRGPLRHRKVWTDYNTANYPGRFNCEMAFFAQGCLQRTQAISAYLAHGAGVVCAEYDNAPLSVRVKNHSCDYNHVQLVRLVVFPGDTVSGRPAKE
ncbi:MAG TPA: hypothetical protein VMW16_10385 [Sedimentisphaerales bacterium]|nr:hypothetical protein [Sedimentisphaerales bacterium]